MAHDELVVDGDDDDDYEDYDGDSRNDSGSRDIVACEKKEQKA